MRTPGRNTMDQGYTEQSAREARDEGRLEAWIQAFLRSPGGNVALADGLNLDERRYWGPVEMLINHQYFLR